MPKRGCSICTHAERDAIDATLQNGGSLRQVARQWRVGKDAVARHRAHLTTPQTTAPAYPPPVEAPPALRELETAFVSAVTGVRAIDARAETVTKPTETPATTTVEPTAETATTEQEARRVLPAWILEAIAPAQASSRGNLPVVVLRHRCDASVKDLLMMRLSDFLSARE